MATGRAVDFSTVLDASLATFAGRAWALARIDAFIANGEGRQVLLVLGEPGAGKTTLLAHVAHRTRAPHFFFGRSDQLGADQGGGYNETIRCAETLGTQLVRAHGTWIVDWGRFGLEVIVHAKRVFGRLTGIDLGDYAASLRPPDKPVASSYVDVEDVHGVVTGITIHELRIDPMLALHELFLGPLRRAAASTQHHLVIVIDALDELDRVERQLDLLDLLERSNLPANVRIIASARPSYATRAAPGTVRLDLSAADAQALLDGDIGNYIDAVSSRKGAPLAWETRTKLVARAAGNFLLATYLVDSIEDGALPDPAAPLPAGLSAYYRTELNKLAALLEEKGLRDQLGPLLAVLCSAREPLDAATAARAAGLAEDAATDLLQRMRSFIRVREVGGAAGLALRYDPFQLAFSDYVLSGQAGFGISPYSGHQRLAQRIGIDPAASAGWSTVGAYAIGHTLAHLASSGAEGVAQTRALVADPAYLAARVQRLGPASLDADLRSARQAGFEPPHLQQIVVELALRAPGHESAGISAAQGLAAIASSIGAPQAASSFARLAPEAIQAVPQWSCGLDRASVAAGWLRSGGAVESAALGAGSVLTLCIAGGGVEIWDLAARVRLASLPAGAKVQAAQAQPGGGHVWVATADGAGSLLRALALADGAVLRTISLAQPLAALAVSDDGAWLAAGSTVGRVVLIDPSSGEQLAKRDIGARIARLAFDQGCLAALGVDRKVVCWSLPELALEGLGVLPGSATSWRFIDRTEGMAIDAARMHAVVGGDDGSVSVLPLDGGDSAPQLLARLSAWADTVAILDRHTVVAGDASGRLHFIGYDAAAAPVTVRAHTGPIQFVAALRAIDGVAAVGPTAALVSVASDEIGLWQRPDAGLKDEACHAAAVADLAWNDAGTGLLSLADDGSLFEWSAQGQLRQRAWLRRDQYEGIKLCADLRLIAWRRDAIEAVALADAGPELVSATPWPVALKDKCASMFDFGAPEVHVDEHALLAAVDARAGLEVWQTSPPQCRLRLPEHRCAGAGALSADGRFLILKNPAGALACLTLDETLAQRPITFGHTLLCGPFWTEQGLRLLTRDDATMYCLCGETLALRASWPVGADAPRFALPSRDGALVVVFGAGGQVQLRRPTDGRRMGGFMLRPPPAAAAFDRDGDRLAIGDLGGGIQVMHLQAREGGSDDT